MDKLERECPLGLKNATEINAMKDYNEMRFKEIDSKIEAIFDKIESVLKELHRLEQKYADRLPMWGSLLMTGMASVIGILATALVQTFK